MFCSSPLLLNLRTENGPSALSPDTFVPFRAAGGEPSGKLEFILQEQETFPGVDQVQQGRNS